MISANIQDMVADGRHGTQESQEIFLEPYVETSCATCTDETRLNVPPNSLVFIRCRWEDDGNTQVSTPQHRQMQGSPEMCPEAEMDETRLNVQPRSCYFSSASVCYRCEDNLTQEPQQVSPEPYAEKCDETQVETWLNVTVCVHAC